MKTSRMNRRGNVLDMFYTLPAVLLIVFLLIFMGAKIINGINTGYSQSNLDSSLVSSATENNENTIKSFSYWPIVFLGIGIIGILFIASYLNTSGAVLFFVVIIFLMLAGTTFIYTNVLDSSITDESFSLEKTQMPEAVNLIDLIPFILIGGGIILLVVMYAKIRSPE